MTRRVIRLAVLAPLLAIALMLPAERADAHYVSEYEASAALWHSNYAGKCGDGATWWCEAKWWPSCYRGGDGLCRVGSHSLQIQGSYQEWSVMQFYQCNGVYRMFHQEFGETYWETCV